MAYHGSQHKPVVEAMLVDFEYPDIKTGHEGEDGNGHDGDLDDEQSRPTMLWVIIVGLWPCSHHLERWVTHDDVVSVSLVVTLRELSSPDPDRETERVRPAAAGWEAGGSSLYVSITYSPALQDKTKSGSLAVSPPRG